MAEPLLIVIPCLNEERHLGPLVAVLRQESGTAPIVIVDGGSTDRTREIAAELAQQCPQVTLLHNPRRLQSAAVNLAVAKYGDAATYLLRIDAHAGYPADYCRVLLAEALQTGADAVAVPMRTAGTGCFQRAVAAAQNSKLGNGGSAHRLQGGAGRWVDHGHHALIRVAAFSAVGGYDESFSHNEDAELDARLRAAGFQIWLTGQTSLTYYPRSAAWPLARQYFAYGNGRARTLLKHRQRPKLRQLAPVLVAPAALLALPGVFWPPAALPLLGWAALCLGYGAALAWRGSDRCLWLTGAAAMLMHLAWSCGFWRGLLRSLQGRRA